MLLFWLLLSPLATALLCWLMPRGRWREVVNVVGATITLGLGLSVLVLVTRNGALRSPWGLLYADALSALMVATIATIGFAAALFSVAYLRTDLAAGYVPQGEAGLRWYYLGFHAFIWTMLITVTVASLGLLWVAMEATTLASALLVGFYRSRAALEAVWKYLVLCTVGITIALFGVILTYLAGNVAGLTDLDWAALAEHGDRLDPAMMRLAFVFVLIGFGTKAGFAPLHTWLADAHSQAPSPISAVLSGVLLSCALYGILRFHTLTTLATKSDFSGRLLLLFGVLSVAVAVPFLLVQRDLKRLLAYSSVEHIGLIAAAIGFGGPIGVYAGLLHLVNHAVTKALLFFIAGDLGQRFGTRRLSAMRGAIQVAPLLGWGLFLGLLSIAGAPPASIFVSEFGIVTSGFSGDTGEAIASGAIVFLLALAFAALLAHALRIAYGSPPASVTEKSAVAFGTSAHLLPIVAAAPLAALAILFGIHVPDQFSDLLRQVALVLTPAVTGANR